MHRRYAGYRFRVEHAVSDDSQAARSFGDERTPIRQKRQTPRMGQATCDDHQTHLWVLGRVEHVGPLWQGARRQPWRRLGEGDTARPQSGAKPQSRTQRQPDRPREDKPKAPAHASLQGFVANTDNSGQNARGCIASAAMIVSAMSMA